MPGDLATAWVLYLLARGHRRRARAFARLVKEAGALLRSPGPPPARVSGGLLEAAKRKVAALKLRKRQIDALRRLLAALELQHRELARLDAQLKAFAQQDNPMLAEPEIRQTLASVESGLPAALAGARQVIQKLERRLRELEADYRRELEALDRLRAAGR
ncbi:MAG TPA: hypothetical protein VEK12_08280 [Alphaproteobacteria bacterium]|nr:hypothetical protein [Alphaproteobacteria bacterium]